MSYIQDSPSRFLLSYESLKSRKRRIFLPTCYIQGQEIQEAKEAPEFRQGWSAAKNKGGVKKKRRRPRKVVCRHKKGREKEEKKKTKEGKKVAPRRQGSVCPQPRISFLVHEYLGLEAARLV